MFSCSIIESLDEMQLCDAEMLCLHYMLLPDLWKYHQNKMISHLWFTYSYFPQRNNDKTGDKKDFKATHDFIVQIGFILYF